MSIISDPDWAIYQLRLSYLRRIDDHHGTRIISFPPSRVSATALSSAAAADRANTAGPDLSDTRKGHGSLASDVAKTSQALNPIAPDSHIAIGRLNDPEVFPEIRNAYSPIVGPQRNPIKLASASGRVLSPPSTTPQRWRHQTPGPGVVGLPMMRRGSEEPHDTYPQQQVLDRQRQIAGPSKVRTEASLLAGLQRLGGGLKYTQTIYGPGRTGALGMRVSGRRAGWDVMPASSSLAPIDPSAQPTLIRATGNRASQRAQDTLRKAIEGERAVTSSEKTASSFDNSIRFAEDAGIPQLEVHRATADGSGQVLSGLEQSERPDPSFLKDEYDNEGTELQGNGSTILGPEIDASSGCLRCRSQNMLRTGSAHVFRQTLSASDSHFPILPHRRRSATLDDPSREAVIIAAAASRSRGQLSPAFTGSRADDIDKLDLAKDPTPAHAALSPVSVRSRPPIDPAKSPLPLRPVKDALRHLQSDSSLSSVVSASDISIEASPRWRARIVEGPDESFLAGNGNDRSWDFARPAAQGRRISRALSPLGKLGRIEDSEPIQDNQEEYVNADPTRQAGTSPTVQDDIRSVPSGKRPGAWAESKKERPNLPAPKPSSEALIAARSRLRKPSRSHLQNQTFEDRMAEHERRKNAWFQSLSISNQQVAQKGIIAQQSDPKPSALSLLLKKQNSAPENPFSQFYARIAGRSSAVGPGGSARIDVYFPWAEGPGHSPSAGAPASGALSIDISARCFSLNVRTDATMEELIGYGLYCYFEEGWLPALRDKGPPEEILTTVGWVLRIVEDGEVDDDYPSLDRTLTVGKFGGDEFAICEASQAQIKQNKASFSLVNRKPSKVVGQSLRSGADGPVDGLAIGPRTARPIARQTRSGITSAIAPGADGAPAQPDGGLLTGLPRHGNGKSPSSSLALSRTTPTSGSALGLTGAPSIFLRVLITPNDEVRYKTTLSVESEMYLADVLDLICRKRQLGSPEEWAFVVPGDGIDHQRDIIVPLDRTVESLQGSHDLALVRRSTLGAQGGTAALAGQSTNPKASIFRSHAEQAMGTGSDGLPFADSSSKGLALVSRSAFKSWTVTRRLPPMFHVGSHRQHERTLTIDGDWIHIVPTDSRAFHAHAASFPISDVASCKQSGKMANQFKLLVAVKRVDNDLAVFAVERQQKRYDLEAEDARQAAEIIREVNIRRRRSRS